MDPSRRSSTLSALENLAPLGLPLLRLAEQHLGDRRVESAREGHGLEGVLQLGSQAWQRSVRGTNHGVATNIGGSRRKVVDKAVTNQLTAIGVEGGNIEHGTTSVG